MGKSMSKQRLKHFWQYIGGSWATESEILYKFRCKKHREEREWLGNPGLEDYYLKNMNTTKFWNSTPEEDRKKHIKQEIATLRKQI